ncbi:PilZ domain-containing protein [Myxococcota bacterium]|nr:PilZ domain-containing protein [Myxococcota bacterium]
MQSRRRFERVACRLGVELQIGARVRLAEAVNLSLGGMLLSSDLHPEYGRIISARVYLPEPAHVCDLNLQVMWSRPDAFGVAFDALRPLDVWALLRYLEAQGASPETN